MIENNRCGSFSGGPTRSRSHRAASAFVADRRTRGKIVAKGSPGVVGRARCGSSASMPMTRTSPGPLPREIRDRAPCSPEVISIERLTRPDSHRLDHRIVGCSIWAVSCHGRSLFATRTRTMISASGSGAQLKRSRCGASEGSDLLSLLADQELQPLNPGVGRRHLRQASQDEIFSVQTCDQAGSVAVEERI